MMREDDQGKLKYCSQECRWRCISVGREVMAGSTALVVGFNLKE